MPVPHFSMEKDNTAQTPDFVTCGGSANLATVRLESLIRRNILWLGFEAKHQGKRLENSGKKKFLDKTIKICHAEEFIMSRTEFLESSTVRSFIQSTAIKQPPARASMRSETESLQKVVHPSVRCGK